MDDHVSRQWLLDEYDRRHEGPPGGARKIIEEAPAAQSEIIHCKDCKNWIPYDWMFGETWQSQNMDDYPQDEIGCSYCDMAMKADDFCSRAERRAKHKNAECSSKC